MANRQELEQALAEGCTVQVAGHVHAIKYPDPLPSDSVPGQQYTGVVTRDANGHLTRHGMELAIAQGGSVMHHGKPISDAALLPTAADLAKHDKNRAEAERKRLLDQRIQIDGELSKLDAAGQSTPDAGKSGKDDQAAELERLRKELAELKARQTQPPPPPQATPVKRDDDEDRVGPRRK